MSSLTYWAAEQTSQKAVTGALERIKRYQEYLKTSGRAFRARRAWLAYYGYGPDGDRDTAYLAGGGVQGELLKGTSNLFATLVQQSVVMTTSSKPSFKAIASNVDFKSMSQALLADGLLEFYDRKVKLSNHERDAVFNAVLMGEAWLTHEWDTGAGRDYTVDPETGQPVKEGDIRTSCQSLFDVAYDVDLAAIDKMTWLCIRRKANRYDLAAKYPGVAQKLIQRTARTNDSDDGWRNLPFMRLSEDKTDTIEYWELRHLPTPACPKGRFILFCDQDTVMHDSVEAIEGGEPVDHGYQYTELYAYVLRPERLSGVGIGHTNTTDLLSLQTSLDMAMTAAVSNANASAVNNFWTPPGSNISTQEIAGGLNILECEAKPELLKTNFLDPALLQFVDLISNAMLRRVGMSNVTLGETPKNMPAQMAALIEAKSIQFQSSLGAAYADLVQESRTGIIQMLKQFASTKRVALMAGKANRYQLKSFSSDDLQGVERVTVEQVNPASRTLAGKQAQADMLLQHGLIKTPAEYLTLINTGREEPLYDGEQANLMRLAQEKEMLQEGVGLPPVQLGPDGMPMFDAAGLPMFADDGQPHIKPLKYDTHWLDIPELLSVMAAPDARDNPQVVKAVTELVEFKQHLWELLTPEEQKMLGCPPDLIRIPAPPPMMPPPMGPDGDSTKPPMPGEGVQTPGPKPGDTHQTKAPGLPPGAPPINLPKPPPNPLTGVQPPAPTL